MQTDQPVAALVPGAVTDPAVAPLPAPAPQPSAQAAVASSSKSATQKGVTLRILSLNVQEYRVVHRKDKLQTRLKKLIEDSNADIVALQEDRENHAGLSFGRYNDASSCQSNIRKKNNTNSMRNSFLVHTNRDRAIKISAEKNPWIDFKDRCPTARCAAFLNVKIGEHRLIICNVQLCGSPFDEEYVIQSIREKHEKLDEIINTKRMQVEQLLQKRPDIVLGDFHGDIDTTTDGTIGRYKLKSLDLEILQMLEVYRHGIHAFIGEKGYIPAFNRNQVKITNRDGGVVDWIYVKPEVFGKITNIHVLEALDVSTHNALVIDLTF